MLNATDNDLITRVGPNTPMGNLLRRYWTPFLEASKLPVPDCDPVEVRLLGEDLVAFRDSNGDCGLLENRCPHRGAPLFYGRNEEGGLRCIYHGWKFNVTGTCLDMPSEPPESNFKDKIRARSYPVREMAGILWTYMGPSHLNPELPDLEWANVPDAQRNIVRYNQNCNWVQAMEGDIDSSHIGFLHQSAYRNRTNPDNDYQLYDRSPTWVIESTQYGVMLAARRRTAEDNTDYWRVNHWFMPYYTMIATDLELKRNHGHVWVPVDDTHTDVWCVIWAPRENLTDQERYLILDGPEPHIGTLDPATGKLRATKENHFLQDREFQRTASFTGIRGIREQDTAVVEGMGAIVDRTLEHLGVSDSAIIAMRRWLQQQTRALMEGEEPYAATHADAYRYRSWSALLERDIPFNQNPKVKDLMAPMA